MSRAEDYDSSKKPKKPMSLGAYERAQAALAEKEKGK